MQSQINVGFGSDITIADLANAVSKAIGYQGNIDFDPTQPDGAPRKLMDINRLNALGWQAKVNLRQGLAFAYQEFVKENSR
jgi:GDP-L-fucose synthase